VHAVTRRLPSGSEKQTRPKISKICV
jgi:hypothetical protein